MPWDDTLYRVVLEVVVAVGCIGIVRAEPEKIEKKLIGRVRGGNRVQGDDAGVGLADAVGLVFALGIGLGLDGELRWVDQAVTPQASDCRPDLAYGGHRVFDGATEPGAHLGAHLGDRNEVLVGKSVDDEAGTHGVGGEEDEVAVSELLRNGLGNDVLGDAVELCAVREFAGVTSGYLSL